MVDIIAVDGDTAPILAGPGDRVFVNEGVAFLARIVGPIGGVEVTIDGTVRTEDVFIPEDFQIPQAVILEGAGVSLDIGATGLIDAENAVRLTGADVQFQNEGVIKNTLNDWSESRTSTGVLFESTTGSFLNTGMIGRARTDMWVGVSFQAPGLTGSAEALLAENSGTIGGFYAAVSMGMDDMTFVNSGKLVGEAVAVDITGENASLVNTGRIKDADGVEEYGPYGSAVRISGDGARVQNDGRINGSVIADYADDVTVANNGVIRSDTYGVAALSDRYEPTDPDLISQDFLLHNTGTIRIVEGGPSFYTFGVYLDADEAAVVNEGKILGAQFGVYATWGGVLLQNSGIIQGHSVAVASEVDGAFIFNAAGGVIEGIPGGENDAIGIAAIGDAFTLVNEGVVRGEWAGVALTNDGFFVEFFNAEIVNSGLIESTGVDDPLTETWALRLDASESTVENSGTIRGTDYGVLMIGDKTLLTNTGLIELTDPSGGIAAVSMVGEGIEFFNSGTVIGDVVLTSEADAVYQGRRGAVEGVISLGDGNDLARGGAEADVMQAGLGDDILKGYGGADDLDGEAGEDRLVGGEGDDILTGGLDADVFVFEGDIGDDVVTDFEVGVDMLQLKSTSSITEADLLALISETAAGVLIDFSGITGGVGSILLEGITLAEFDLQDIRYPERSAPSVAQDVAPEDIQNCFDQAPVPLGYCPDDAPIG